MSTLKLMHRKKIRSILDQLDYGWSQFTIEHFVAHVAAVRKRPIVVSGVALHEVTGMCVSLPTRDYIFYDVRRHRAVQVHITLHELAHLLLGHVSSVEYTSRIGDLQSILLHINTRIAVTQTNEYLWQEELEAEYLAHLIQQSVRTAKRLDALTRTDSAADVFIPPFTGDFVKGKSDDDV